MNILKRLYFKIARNALNNSIVNLFMILTENDHLAKKWIKNWSEIGMNPTKSLLENTGITDNQEILKTLENCKKTIKQTYYTVLNKKGSILDIGCGPGLFLKEFDAKSNELWGIDMNPDFVAKAKELIPDGHFVLGNFLKSEINHTFSLIYSSSVLMYIEKSKIKTFFSKIHSHLETKGIMCIHYPHALQKKDLYYHDLSYIRYSPAHIEKLISEKFDILKHEHAYDSRKVTDYDRKHYYYPNGKNNRLDTLQNTYILIARKK